MAQTADRIRGAVTKKTKRFGGMAGDTLWSGGSDGLVVVTALVSVLLLTKSLGTDGYGKFGGVYALATIFSAITYSGPGLALLQRRFRHEDSLESLFRSYLSLAVIAASFSTILAVGISMGVIDLSAAEIVVVVASELFANSIVWVAGWLVQAAAGFRAMMRVRIGTTLLKLVTLPVLYFSGNLTIFNLGLAYLVLYGMWASWLVFFQLPKLGYPLKFGRPPKKAWKESAEFAVPLAASQIQMEGDRVVLNAYGFEKDAGVYGLGFRIVLLGLMPIRVIQQAAFHRFLPDGDGEPGYHLRKSIRFSGLMFAAGMAAVVFLYGLLFISNPIIDVLINEEFAETREILPWLILFIPLQSLSATPLNGLLGMGKARERAYTYLSSALLSVILYLVFIPVLAWKGAVLATLLGETYLVFASWGILAFYQKRENRELRAAAAIDLTN